MGLSLFNWVSSMLWFSLYKPALQTGKVIGRVSGYVKTQLIAHDKEVHDIAFTRAGGGRDLFASVGSDGSVRMFDLRQVSLNINVHCICQKVHILWKWKFSMQQNFHH